ncbi:MAG TPA: flagellar biosynthesis protein FlhB [Massilibacterium sp.]|nr:flagellar biosynthesis protein FlhB [Massilibacterium sp.]
MNVLKVDLQFFAGEKTEKATPKKRQDSRKKGQVAKSTDINTAITLLVVFLFLGAIAGFLRDQLISFFTEFYTYDLLMDINVENIHQMFVKVSMKAIIVVAPVLAVALFAGVFANFIQVGALFAPEAIKFKLERVNPLKGFKRIFSMRAIVELLKSLLKITLVGIVTFSILFINKEQVMQLSEHSISNALVIIAKLTFQMGLATSILLIFLAILDYAYQKFDFEKNIRMSKQDIKDEYKKVEGDPLIKSKIKERQRQMAMQRMMQEVPNADVIITNPTHYAIALKYDDEMMDAPVIVAKGVDYLAMKIKEVAKKNNIVMVENKPLARSLYSKADIGDVIPEEFYKTVAEIIAYVYRIQNQA